jgi:hypothetical protein
MEKPYSGYNSTYASWFEVLGWLGDQWFGVLGQLAFRMISWPYMHNFQHVISNCATLKLVNNICFGEWALDLTNGGLSCVKWALNLTNGGPLTWSEGLIILNTCTH